MVFFLKDTSAADLSAIIEFMYKGSVNVAQTQLASFLKTAEMLQIKGLSGEEDKPVRGARHGTWAGSGLQVALCQLFSAEFYSSLFNSVSNELLFGRFLLPVLS